MTICNCTNAHARKSNPSVLQSWHVSTQENPHAPHRITPVRNAHHESDAHAMQMLDSTLAPRLLPGTTLPDPEVKALEEGMLLDRPVQHRQDGCRTGLAPQDRKEGDGQKLLRWQRASDTLHGYCSMHKDCIRQCRRSITKTMHHACCCMYGTCTHSGK